MLYDAAITPDGRLAATASVDGTVLVWMRTSAGRSGPSISTTGPSRRRIQPDGSLLVLAGGETADILDVSAGDVPASSSRRSRPAGSGVCANHGQLARVAPELARCPTVQ